MAKAAAYSSILTVFPAFLLLASALASAGLTARFIREIQYAVGAILPPGSVTPVLGYFRGAQNRTTHLVISAGIVTLLAATGVMISWMEGFRRAYGFERNPWRFWRERGVAVLLVVLALLPMTFASVLVAFGVQIENWMFANTSMLIEGWIVLLWTVIRWTIALVTGVAVLALIYHHGLPRVQPWYRVVPGAALATGLWFVSTVSFGWYVTRFANYDQIYGSLGAAIALLVWLYLVSIVVLIGAEFNALIYPMGDKLREGAARAF